MTRTARLHAILGAIDAGIWFVREYVEHRRHARRYPHYVFWHCPYCCAEVERAAH